MKKAPIIGSGSGAAIGFLFGGPVGAAIGAAVGFLGGRRYDEKEASGMTPDRKAIFEEALKSLKDPIQLNKLADEFERQGLTNEANLLKARARLKDLPPEQKALRKQAFRKALEVGKGGTTVTLEQIQKVEKMAATFQSQGATGNAAALRQHAAGLRKLLK